MCVSLVSTSLCRSSTSAASCAAAASGAHLDGKPSHWPPRGRSGRAERVLELRRRRLGRHRDRAVQRIRLALSVSSARWRRERPGVGRAGASVRAASSRASSAVGGGSAGSAHGAVAAGGAARARRGAGGCDGAGDRRVGRRGGVAAGAGLADGRSSTRPTTASATAARDRGDDRRACAARRGASSRRTGRSSSNVPAPDATAIAVRDSRASRLAAASVGYFRLAFGMRGATKTADGSNGTPPAAPSAR